jgi:16S rRNA (adenine1518-N6/adenine1519-N6)-dimethyltransferase
LTLALAETGAEVTAVEIDRHLTPALREVTEGLGVTVIEGDATELDWDQVLGAHETWTLVANLPYNVATPLVLDLLRDVPRLTTMLVMVQREVGERLAAGPGTSSYGIPSVMVGYHGRATVVGRVPATVFLPVPKVESALVRIERHASPVTAVPLAEIESLVRTAFGQRRKMLRRSLAGAVDPEQFSAADIDPRARPETLGVEDWARLAVAVRA